MPDYIIEPLDTDPDSIFANFVDFVRFTFPNWNPSEGQLDVIIPKFMSTQTALTADMASRVQRAIFRYFGATIVNIPPLPGSFAQATIQFTVSDGLAHQLPANTVVGLTDLNGDTHMFMMLADVNIPATPGPTTNSGTAVATDLGSYNNGLSGTVFMIEMFDWIDSAVVLGVSSGGTDPEEDSVYLNRLTTNLGMMSPRPILAEDFALLAQNIAGVWRAAVIDNYELGLNEIQELDSSYASGSFTITLEGGTDGGPNTTVPIPATATADEVEAAIGSARDFSSDDVRATGGPLGSAPMRLEFIGRWGATAMADVIVNTSGLSGGGGGFIVTPIQDGTAPAYNGEFTAAISAVDEDGRPLLDVTREELMLYLQSMCTQDFALYWVDPAYYEVHVAVEVVPTLGADYPSVVNSVEQTLLNYLSPANAGQGQVADGQSRTWIPFNVVRYLELTTVVENVIGVDHIKTLTFGIDIGVMSTADKVIAAPFSLTYSDPSFIDVTASVS
jgi:hypothetical protein